jgi:hypothetical protein
MFINERDRLIIMLCSFGLSGEDISSIKKEHVRTGEIINDRIDIPVTKVLQDIIERYKATSQYKVGEYLFSGRNGRISRRTVNAILKKHNYDPVTMKQNFLRFMKEFLGDKKSRSIPDLYRNNNKHKMWIVLTSIEELINALDDE